MMQPAPMNTDHGESGSNGHRRSLSAFFDRSQQALASACLVRTYMLGSLLPSLAAVTCWPLGRGKEHEPGPVDAPMGDGQSPGCAERQDAQGRRGTTCHSGFTRAVHRCLLSQERRGLPGLPGARTAFAFDQRGSCSSSHSSPSLRNVACAPRSSSWRCRLRSQEGSFPASTTRRASSRASRAAASPTSG